MKENKPTNRLREEFICMATIVFCSSLILYTAYVIEDYFTLFSLGVLTVLACLRGICDIRALLNERKKFAQKDN